MQQAGTRRGAAAAKITPLSLPKCDGQIRTALSPGALYPHPVPKQNAQKCLDGRVWWVLIDNQDQKFLGISLKFQTNLNNQQKFLQNYRLLKNGLEKAVLPLFPMLFSSKSGTPNTPRNQTPSLNCGKTTKNFSSKSDYFNTSLQKNSFNFPRWRSLRATNIR